MPCTHHRLFCHSLFLEKFFEKSVFPLDKPILFCYNSKALWIWCHSQVVRPRSATPSSPVQIWVAPPKNSESECFRNFFIQAVGLAYHHAQACISSPKAYLITRQRAFSCGLMIYKAYRFDDIQFLRNWWYTRLRRDVRFAQTDWHPAPFML